MLVTISEVRSVESFIFRSRLGDLDTQMNGNASLDPDAARSNTIALVVDYPVVFLNLPSNVSALIVETNAGTVDIPREELQSMA